MARQKCTFKLQLYSVVWKDKSVHLNCICIFKWKDKSVHLNCKIVRLNGKRKVYI